MARVESPHDPWRVWASRNVGSVLLLYGYCAIEKGCQSHSHVANAAWEDIKVQRHVCSFPHVKDAFHCVHRRSSKFAHAGGSSYGVRKLRSNGVRKLR